jgi:hypothetical protein
MSVKVDIDELAAQLESFGFAYLLSVGEDLRPHAVAVRPALAQGLLVVEALGRRTRENLGARPDVSLVWPPVDDGGYSLIVDGRCVLTEAGASVEPAHAVLHRPADHGAAAGASDCGNDCVTVGS